MARKEHSLINSHKALSRDMEGSSCKLKHNLFTIIYLLKGVL